MATSRRTAITADEETAGTIALDVQTLQLTGRGGRNLIERQPQPTTGSSGSQPNAVPTEGAGPKTVQE